MAEVQTLAKQSMLIRFDDIRYCADAVYKRGILPETEVFDIGMLHNMAVVKSEQPFADPMLFNLVFGHKGGMQPTPEMLAAFRSFVPSDALWGVYPFLAVITGHFWLQPSLWEQR